MDTSSQRYTIRHTHEDAAASADLDSDYYSVAYSYLDSLVYPDTEPDGHTVSHANQNSIALTHLDTSSHRYTISDTDKNSAAADLDCDFHPVAHPDLDSLVYVDAKPNCHAVSDAN